MDKLKQIIIRDINSIRANDTKKKHKITSEDIDGKSRFFVHWSIKGKWQIVSISNSIDEAREYIRKHNRKKV